MREEGSHSVKLPSTVKNTGAVLESAEKLGSKHLADWATEVLQMIPEGGKSVLWAALSSDFAAFTLSFSIAALLSYSAYDL